jgi:dynein light intermediate chain 1
LIYTSTKQSINCGLLMEYLQNQLYELDFGHPAQVVEKESIFVPSGWDSSAKIAADFENQRLTANPEEPFENVISFPAVLKLHQKDATAIAAATAEDDNNFLTRMYQAVIADTKATPNEKKSAAFFDQLKKYGTAVGATPGATPSATPSSSSSLPPTTPSTDKIAPRALSFTPTSAPQNDEAMSFFNSILQSDTPPVMPTPKKDPKAE